LLSTYAQAGPTLAAGTFIGKGEVMKLLGISTIGAAALLLTAGGTLAQSRVDQTQLTGAPPDTWSVQGKVVDLERRPDLVTMLRLDNGASLQVTPESQGPGQPAQVGDSIMARYAEVGARDKLATQVRVIETQAP
jgi:hypothetical protein